VKLNLKITYAKYLTITKSLICSFFYYKNSYRKVPCFSSCFIWRIFCSHCSSIFTNIP